MGDKQIPVYYKLRRPCQGLNTLRMVLLNKLARQVPNISSAGLRRTAHQSAFNVAGPPRNKVNVATKVVVFTGVFAAFFGWPAYMLSHIKHYKAAKEAEAD